MIEFSDSSLLIICVSNSGISGNKTINNLLGTSGLWSFEISKYDGTIIQQNAIQKAWGYDWPSLLKTASGRLFLTSFTSEGVGGDKTDPDYGRIEMWVVESDDNLNVIQDKYFGGIWQEDFGSLQEVGGFLYLSCRSNSNMTGNKTAPNFGTAYDSWLIKVDEDLNIIWDRTYGGKNDDSGGTLFLNSNGKLVFGMSSRSLPGKGNKTKPNSGDSDGCILILDPNEGSIIAQEFYGGTGSELGIVGKLPNSDSHLLFRAGSNSGISGIKTVPS